MSNTDLQTVDGGFSLSMQKLDLLERVATIMASGRVSLPKELVGNVGDCFAIAMQAQRWGLDPYVVASQAFVVNGRIGYGSQLINAMVSNSGAIDGHFRYEFEGETKCRVGATLKGDSEITWGHWVDATKQTVKNSPLWKTDPQQQLSYLAVKKWARVHAPGAIMGIYSPDELSEVEVKGEAIREVKTQAPREEIQKRIEQISSEQVDSETGEVIEETPTEPVQSMPLKSALAKIESLKTFEECNEMIKLKKDYSAEDARTLHAAIGQRVKSLAADK